MTHFIDPSAFKKLDRGRSRILHIVTIATKPDIIKQAPIYQELVDRGEQVWLCHTGQHYDHNYSGGMLSEFGLTVDLHLEIDGPLHTKAAQIIDRFGRVLQQLIDEGWAPVPYIHGDTATSMAVGVASYLCGVACVHVEAGLRTLTPRSDVYEQFYADFRADRFDWGGYRDALLDPKNFERGSREPFPEQFNTRVSDAATGFHAAPVELNRGFLLDEGFPADTIEVTGNTVVDAMATATSDADKATVFETYPQLLSGKFIRFCIHRRENTADAMRFTVLFDAIERLIRTGHSVLLIRLFGTDDAIRTHGLEPRLKSLEEEFPVSFISSPVWPHYRDVMAAMAKCRLVATDSGSMQEEMNALGIPCVTLRFGSDRAESVLGGSNVLAPPVDSEFVASIIEHASSDDGLALTTNLYGHNVSSAIVDAVLAQDGIKSGQGLFRPEEQRLRVRQWSAARQLL